MLLPRSAAGRCRAAAVMWRSGMLEALQLQRCVVFFVLDSSGKVLAQTTKCLVTNGVVYLGSILLFNHATKPCMDWLLATYAEPAYGSSGVAAWQQLLAGVHQLLWLLPVYGVTLMASCMWYQQIAVAAFEVQHKQQQQQQQHSDAAAGASSSSQPQPAGVAGSSSAASAAAPPAAAPAGGRPPDWLLQPPQQQQQADAAGGGGSSSAGSSSSSGMMQALEGTAQEVFRLLLFVVFTAEVFVISLVPGIGSALNLLFLSWLYAYYCFDYKWALQGVRLPQRLRFFEANWAYFAGFGFPCVAATMFRTFHVGAALANLLFPVFVMVACGADPMLARGGLSGGAAALEAPAGALPIFKLALRPTYWLVQRVFGPRSSRSRSSSRDKQA